MSDRHWLTIKEAAEILSVSPATVRRMIYAGRLQATDFSVVPGRRVRLWRIHPQALDSLHEVIPANMG